MPVARRRVSRLGARAVAEAFGQPAVTGVSGDPAPDAECQKLLAQLRQRCPELVPAPPLPPGTVGAPLPVSSTDLPALARAAIRAASGLPPAPAAGAPPVGGVTWVDGDRELYVAVEQVDVRLAPGAVAVTIPVRCDQTGATEVDISFAIGLPDRPLGLVAATEDRPRGPTAVVDVWGDALIALAWQCLLDVASGISAASGSDVAGTPLIASALHSDGKTLSVTPQARFAFDAGSLGPK
jgi:hypothetical protein